MPDFPTICPDELVGLKAHAASALAPAITPDTVLAPTPRAAVPGPPPPPDVLAGLEARLADAVGEIGRLKTAVAALEAQVADLRKQLGLGG